MDAKPMSAAGTRHYTLGGAVLTELALLGRIEIDDAGMLNGPKVTPSGEGPLPDTSTTVTRASGIERGHCGPETVATAVTRTAAAVVAASAASVGR